MLWGQGRNCWSDLQGQGNVWNLCFDLNYSTWGSFTVFLPCVCMCFFMHMRMLTCTSLSTVLMVSHWMEELADYSSPASWRAFVVLLFLSLSPDAVIIGLHHCTWCWDPNSSSHACAAKSFIDWVIPPAPGEAEETSAGSLDAVWEVCPHWSVITVPHCCPSLACRNQSVPTALGLVRITFHPCVSEPALLIHWSWSSLDEGSFPLPLPHGLDCKMIPSSGLQWHGWDEGFGGEETLSLLFPQASLQLFVPPCAFESLALNVSVHILKKRLGIRARYGKSVSLPQIENMCKNKHM